MSPREFQKHIAAIRKMGRTIQPSAEWVLRDREQLLAKVRTDLAVQGRSPSLLVAFKEFYRSFLPSQLLGAVRGPVAAFLSSATLILGSSIAGVSAAERAIPGDFLYPVKIATEQTRLVLASDASEKIRLKTEFVVRRVEEIKQLTNNVPKKPERIKEAAENLKQDLDTVKNQLDDTGQTPVDRTKSAKLVDDTGTQVVASLKEIKNSSDPAARSQLADAESAAVSTSVKAVQVILSTQSDAQSQEVVSREELLQLINEKVEGVETHLSNSVQQLAQTVSSTAALTPLSATSTASTTLPLLNATSTVPELLSAHTSLTEARQLLIENKIEEVTDKLVEANKAVNTADKKIEQLTTEMVSSTNAQLSPPTDTSSTLPLPTKATSTTSTVSVAPTSTATTTAIGPEKPTGTK